MLGVTLRVFVAVQPVLEVAVARTDPVRVECLTFELVEWVAVLERPLHDVKALFNNPAV